MSSITAEHFIKSCEIPNRPNQFVLGSFDKRVTVYSQQVRAINLVHSLLDTKRLRKGKNAAIIGGGIAGLTVATAFAKLGMRVQVFERTPYLLWMQKGNKTRWLHPRIYDWPARNSENANAELPVLTWTADQAGNVVDQLLHQWNMLSEGATKKLIKTYTSVTDLDVRPSDHGRSRVMWSRDLKAKEGPKSGGGSFDLVIFAVGFGLEESKNGLQVNSYWNDDNFHRPRGGGLSKFLVSGSGDGGLIDVLRLRLDNFRHQDIVTDFIKCTDLNSLADKLTTIEKTALQSEDLHWLNDQYAALKVPKSIDNALKSRLRTDTEVVLHTQFPEPFTLKSSVLNRFLVSRLRKIDKSLAAKWGKIDVKRAVDGSGYEVKFESGGPEKFDDIIVRHGPTSALKAYFPAIEADCASLVARAGLDQTRIPLWQPEFDRMLQKVVGYKSPTEDENSGGVKTLDLVTHLRIVLKGKITAETMDEILRRLEDGGEGPIILKGVEPE